MQPRRTSMPQMLSCLDTLVQIDAASRLHQARAVHKRSEAELLGRQMKDVRDFLVALLPHHNEIRALLSGERLAPISHVRAAAAQIASEGEAE